MNPIDMENLGFSQRFANEAALYKGLHPGRVISQYKNLYRVATENGELMAEVSGKFQYEAKTASDFPAVGDFVMLDRTDDSGGNAMIRP
jgi:ribosome biogenesis GTPase